MSRPCPAQVKLGTYESDVAAARAHDWATLVSATLPRRAPEAAAVEMQTDGVAKVSVSPEAAADDAQGQAAQARVVRSATLNFRDSFDWFVSTHEAAGGGGEEATDGALAPTRFFPKAGAGDGGDEAVDAGKWLAPPRSGQTSPPKLENAAASLPAPSDDYAPPGGVDSTPLYAPREEAEAGGARSLGAFLDEAAASVGGGALAAAHAWRLAKEDAAGALELLRSVPSGEAPTDGTLARVFTARRLPLSRSTVALVDDGDKDDSGDESGASGSGSESESEAAASPRAGAARGGGNGGGGATQAKTKSPAESPTGGGAKAEPKQKK